MALRFNNTLNDRATFSGEAGLGSSNTHTTLVWFRREANDTGAEVLVLSTATSTYQLKLTATGIQTYSALGASGSAAQSLNTYYCLALVRNAALFSAYQWDTTGARTDIAVNLDSTISNNCTSLRMGDSGGAYTAPRASYRYLRHWSRALSLAELLAEVQFTPTGTGAGAAASTTNLRGSWPLSDATDTTDWSGNSNTLTINSGSTSSDEPSIPAGGASAAISPSILRPNQSTVFGSAAQRFT